MQKNDVGDFYSLAFYGYVGLQDALMNAHFGANLIELS